MSKNKTLFVKEYRYGRNDDEAIAACLSVRRECGSATIVFDGEDYLISQAICLPSDTTVIIDGCTIRQKDETFDNVFRGDNLNLNPENPHDLPLSCKPIRNIRILGQNGAVISGPDKNRIVYHPEMDEVQLMVGDYWGWRNLTISFSRCDGFEVAGITFTKSRCWTMSFDMCSNGYIHDVVFDNHVKNGDGIDFRSGCHDCLVENVTGHTSDDTVACTALFGALKKLPKKVYPLEPSRCIKERSREERDIFNIQIRNVHTSGRHHGIICLAANGSRVYNIKISNISEEPGALVKPWREATVKIYTGFGSGYTPGDLHHIEVYDVRGVYANNAVYCNAQVENVVLENIRHERNEPIRLDYPQGIQVKE